MRPVLLAGEEPQEWPALLRHMITNRAFEHRIAGLQRIEHRPHSNWIRNLKLQLAGDVRQGSQVLRDFDADHGSVCTSTDNTAGRSRTIGAQLSPASVDAYTWPPVVPK